MVGQRSFELRQGRRILKHRQVAMSIARVVPRR